MKANLVMPVSLALTLSLASCERAAPTADGKSEATPAAASADAEAVRKAFASLNAAIVAKDVGAIRTYYADDATMWLPGQAPFKGVEAIMGDYQNYTADPAGKVVMGTESVEISPDGNLAFGEVDYRSTFTDSNSKQVETENRYNLTVFKKQADGGWKIMRDVNVALP